MIIKFKFTDKAIQIMKEAEELFLASAGVSKDIDFTPKRATEGSSGYDLKSCLLQSLTIWQDEVVKIPTGVHVWLGSLVCPLGKDFRWSGLLMPRSSNPGLKLTNTIGLSDDDYQGEIFLKYKNTSDFPISINPGDKIGQLVIIPTYVGDMELDQTEWESTERGSGSFGSTGK